MSGFIGNVNGFNPFSTPVCYAVNFLPGFRIVQIRAFTIPPFRKNHDGFVLVFGIYSNHSYYLIAVTIQRYTTNPYRVTANRSYRRFVKTDGFTIFGSYYHFALAA